MLARPQVWHRGATDSPHLAEEPHAGRANDCIAFLGKQGTDLAFDFVRVYELQHAGPRQGCERATSGHQHIAVPQGLQV